MNLSNHVVRWTALAAVFVSVSSEGITENISIHQEKPLSLYQSELLNTAFELASAIPVEPNLKDRSRAQEVVIDAALELGQPQRALTYTGQVLNWRSGMGYANVAYYLAQHGDTNHLSGYLSSAQRAADGAEQKWRKDRVSARIAQTWLLLGQDEKAEALGKNIELSQSSELERQKTEASSDSEYAELCASYDALIEIGNLDSVKSGILGYAGLYSCFYSSEERRNFIEEKVNSSWKKTPMIERFNIYLLFSNICLSNKDAVSAVRFLEQASAIVSENEWTAEYDVQLLAKLAGQWLECGDKAQAENMLQTAVEKYNAGRDTITDIYRAETLIPVAETYAAFGDFSAALSIYERAVEEATLNPNARPTAEDLSLICVSMAVSGIEPDAEFTTRVNIIKAGLGQPW